MKSLIYYPALVITCVLTNLQAIEDHQINPTMKILESRSVENTRHVLSECTQSNKKVLAMYDKLAQEWLAYSQEHPHQFNLAMVLKGVEFAALKHKGQTRKDLGKTPYIIHPIGVAYNVWNEGGIRSVNVLTAALLHDTLEDTETTEAELETEFGPRVAMTVKEVTNDPTLDSQANKMLQIEHAPMMSMDAQLVKLADRLYNVRDLDPIPSGFTEAKVRVYKWYGMMLLNVLRGTNAGLEAALEQAAQ